MNPLENSTILVTGCGGDIGINVGRILAGSHIFQTIVGADMSHRHPGISTFQKCAILPKASTDTYISELEKLIDETGAKWIIPTAEPELRKLFELGIVDKVGNARLIIANSRAMEVGFDKFKTARFLESCGLPFPWTEIVGEGQPHDFPCILKSRAGAGSVDVTIAPRELQSWYESSRPGHIWQELLSSSEHEYTCCIFRSLRGEVRSIVYNRTLQGGTTKSGHVVENQEITDVLMRIADALNLTGSINVQLRLTSKGPVVFEINPRFSSTLMFRHQMGFTDVLWSLQDAAGLTLPQYSKPPAGLTFYRTYGEYYVGPNGTPWSS